MSNSFRVRISARSMSLISRAIAFPSIIILFTQTMRVPLPSDSDERCDNLVGGGILLYEHRNPRPLRPRPHFSKEILIHEKKERGGIFFASCRKLTHLFQTLTARYHDIKTDHGKMFFGERSFRLGTAFQSGHKEIVPRKIPRKKFSEKSIVLNDERVFFCCCLHRKQGVHPLKITA